MSRGFGLIVTICSLAIVAVLIALSAGQNGLTSKSARTAESRATATVGSLNFVGAGTELEAFQAANGTYVGAALSPSFGVTLVRADAASYCLQAGIGSSVQHLSGPGGTAAAGPC
jgi:hypothetical protein